MVNWCSTGEGNLGVRSGRGVACAGAVIVRGGSAVGCPKTGPVSANGPVRRVGKCPWVFDIVEPSSLEAKPGFQTQCCFPSCSFDT